MTDRSIAGGRRLSEPSVDQTCQGKCSANVAGHFSASRRDLRGAERTGFGRRAVGHAEGLSEHGVQQVVIHAGCRCFLDAASRADLTATRHGHSETDQMFLAVGKRFFAISS
jgi:hypothetical protein